MKFKSKVSYILLLFIFSVSFIPLIFDFINQGLTNEILWLTIFLSVLMILILYVFFGMVYTIEDNMLKIKVGFIKYKPIPIAEIKEISKSYNIISSPAASFDRIEIKYGKYDEIILSPKNKFQFAEELCKINPEIKNKLKK